jgi:ABC-type antimicrobial peptide transport system permease subunit
VIGRNVRLNGVDFTVVGVAPESFTGLDLRVQPGVFVPTAMWARIVRTGVDPLTDRGTRLLTVKGRLARGATRAQASAEAALPGRGLEAAHPTTNRGVKAVVLSELQARIESSPAQATLVPLLTMLAATVLLVGCGNAAGLQLSRAHARRRELAVRLAMGSSCFRLIRQLLTESAIIAAGATVLGLGSRTACSSSCGVSRCPPSYRSLWARRSRAGSWPPRWGSPR